MISFTKDCIQMYKKYENKHEHQYGNRKITSRVDYLCLFVCLFVLDP